MLRHCASLQCATQLALQHSHRLPARRLTALGISRTAPATAASLRTIRGLFTGDVPVPEAPQLFQDLDHGGGSNNSGGLCCFREGSSLSSVTRNSATRLVALKTCVRPLPRCPKAVCLVPPSPRFPRAVSLPDVSCIVHITNYLAA